MKNSILTLFIACLLATPALLSANQVHYIQAGGSPGAFTFEPDGFTLKVGDSIAWYNNSGEQHTSTSTSVPDGAAEWDFHIGTEGDTTDYYVVEVAGDYAYVCQFHAPSHSGSFTATEEGPNSIGDAVNVSEPSVTLYPNPAKKVLTIMGIEAKGSPVQVQLFSMSGRQVLSRDFKEGEKPELSLAGLETGMYILNVESEGKFYREKLMIQ